MRVLFAVSLVVVAGIGTAQHPCTYPAKTIPLHTPAGPDGFNVEVSVGGGPARTLQVDTGSTGVALWRKYIARSTPMPPPRPQPFIYYNSSRKALCGEWVLSDVVIGDAHDTTVPIPDMPVLAVDYMCIGESEQSPCGCRKKITHLPGLGMLGVGFDRRFGMGGARENPFLRLPEMDKGEIHRGYVITTDGITLGMSPDDVAGFQLIPLTNAMPDSPKADWEEEWQQARGCVAITGGGIRTPGRKVCGEILMDTGVDSMYLSYAPASLPAFRPAIAATGDDLWCCCGGPCDFRGPQPAQVTVSWPDTGDAKFTYRAQPPEEFDWQKQNPTMAFIHETLPDPGEKVFVNTSRQLLVQADYLYDATCGYVGFRNKAPQGGTR